MESIWIAYLGKKAIFEYSSPGTYRIILKTTYLGFMLESNTQKSKSIQYSIEILQQALEKLENHDYVSAQVMVGIAHHILDDVQLDLNCFLVLKLQLNELLKQ
ncbi:MAG TPA: hypothetical protein V6C46_08940 [Coleofasciculaceae cyanobacterium]